MCANFVFMCESTCAFILSAAPTFAGEDADAMEEEDREEGRREGQARRRWQADE